MPIHDWTPVEAGIFHAFHHDWITEIARALNRGLLPTDYYALPEQITGNFGPDVLTLGRTRAVEDPDARGGLVLELAPPKVDLHVQSESGRYAAKAKGAIIRHVSNHRIVAMIEIVSPGNKGSRNALDAFVRKAREALSIGIHLLVIDLFPPSRRDPQGIHEAIWDEDSDPDYRLPADKPLTCVAYKAGAAAEAFIDFLAVGQILPKMPLFLKTDIYIEVPLETTYQLAWESMPKYWQDALTETG